MNDPVSQFILAATDIIFGWILWLPRDLALITVALITALLLVVVRRWATDQNRLRRIADDLKVLGASINTAKAKGDKEELARIKALKARLGMIKFRAEGKPLLWSIVPVALLAIWAFERMPTLAPRVGEAVEVRLLHPLSRTDQLAHLLPVEGLGVSSPVARFVTDPQDNRLAAASWSITLSDPPPAALTFVSPDGRYTHPIPKHPRPPAALLPQNADGLISTQMVLPERKLLGLVPGIPALGFSAWMVGYLILVLVGIPLNKRIFKLQ